MGDLGFVLDRLSPDGSPPDGTPPDGSPPDGTPPDGALVCAGDNILRFSLAPLWQHHLETGETTVLALETDDPSRLRRTGVLELDADDRVIRLWEKPETPPSPWACPSFYALDRDALAHVRPYLDSGRPADEIGRFIGRLAELPDAEQRVRALKTRGERLHVGHPESLRHADETLRRESVLLS